MDTALVVAAWITVLGGLSMAIPWLLRGGFGAQGPGAVHVSDVRRRDGRVRRTRWDWSHVLLHGFLGIVGAAIVSAAAARDDDYGTGLLGIAIVWLFVVAGIGVVLVTRWLRGRRDGAHATAAELADAPIEQGTPSVIVALHGLAAVATIVLAIAVAFSR